MGGSKRSKIIWKFWLERSEMVQLLILDLWFGHTSRYGHFRPLVVEGIFKYISVKHNSVLTKACWNDFNTAWSHFLVAISKTNDKLGFPMKSSLLFCDLTCACVVALLHSTASKSPTTVAVLFVWFLLQILSFTLIPHSVGSSHSSSSMACCNEPGFCPSTVQPTAKQVPKISLAVPLNSLAKLFFLICRQMSKKTSAHGNPLQPIAESIQKKLMRPLVTFWKQTPQNKQTWLNHLRISKKMRPVSHVVRVHVTGSWCPFRRNTCRRGEPFSLSLTWKKKVGTKDAGSSLDLPLHSFYKYKVRFHLVYIFSTKVAP